MSTTKEYKDFVLEQLNLLDNIICKSMYLVYDIDNKQVLKEIVIETCRDLSIRK